MITQATIDKIFDAARIEEVVGEFVQLKKAGSNFKGLSPWTDEKTPSFFVSPTKGIFKDFSSGKGGNSVSFLMELENMTYPEALRYLADKYQIEIEETETSDEEKEEISLRESLSLVNQFALEYFTKALWESEDGKNIGLSYFRERGYNDQTLEKFALGYAHQLSDAFTSAAKDAGHNVDHLLKLGLAKENERGVYDFFRERVMFPIRNVSGRPIAFAGRTLRSDNKVKYLNSPESELYDKSKTLYGIYEGKRSMIKEDMCCLVEGYTDVISLHQAGVEFAVASSGTSLTAGQVKLIKRYTSNVSILYDGDSAGIKAAMRAIDLLLEQEMNVRVLHFPDDHDPDSFSKTVSTTELNRYIREEALDFSDFMLDLLLKGAEDDPIKKAEATRQLVQSLALIRDHIARSIYVERCSKRLNIPEQSLYNELNKILRKKQLKKSGVDQDVIESLVKTESKQQDGRALHDPLVHEREIARVLINYGNHQLELEIESEEETDEEKGEETPELIKVSVTEYILQHIIDDEIEFKSPVYKRIVERFLEHFEEHESSPAIDQFISDPEISQEIAGMITTQHELSENWAAKHKIFTTTEEDDMKRTVFDPLMRLKLMHVKKVMSELDEQLKTVTEEEKMHQILQEKMKIDRMKRELTNFFGSAII